MRGEIKAVQTDFHAEAMRRSSWMSNQDWFTPPREAYTPSHQNGEAGRHRGPQNRIKDDCGIKLFQLHLNFHEKTKMALKAACSLFVLASAIPSVLALPAADKNADVCRTGIYAVFSTYQDGSGPTREQCAKYNVQCSPHQRMKRQLSTTPAAPSTTPRAPATTRAISTTPAAPSTAEVTTPSTVCIPHYLCCHFER